MSIVSENIKYLRKSNKLTQEKFASRIGIKRSLLGAYEEARANPNLDNLMNIAKIFGMSVDQLLQEDLRQLAQAPGLEEDGASADALASQKDSPFGKEAEKPNATGTSPLASKASSKALPPIVEKYYRLQDSHSNGRHVQAVHQSIVPKRVRPVLPAAYGLFPKEKPRPTEYTRSEQVVSQAVPEPALLSKSLPDKSLPTIELVRRDQIISYLTSYSQADYLVRLPAFQLPWLVEGHYRAFETGDDFAFAEAIVVGQLVRNWYDLVDGRNYVVVVRQQGILYRRVYNQVKIKGVFLLSSDKPHIASAEISVKDVLEVWEAKAFVSTHLPEPAISLDRLSHLVADLQQELERLKK